MVELGDFFCNLSLYFCSEYHQSCVPAETKRRAEQASTQQTSGSKKDELLGDTVTQDEIWKQSVATEERGVRAWYDSKDFFFEQSIYQ